MRARVTTVAAVILLVGTLLAGLYLLVGAGPLPQPGRVVPVGSTADPSDPSASPGPVHGPRPLAPGERPPQFVVVSFDGVGWHAMWQHWLAIGERVPFRFTGFLSGTYLLSDRTRAAYHPPYYPAGTSAIAWNPVADLPDEIRDLNRALAAGDEIGTHFNGRSTATGPR